MAKKEELKAALYDLIKKVDAGEEVSADDVRKLIDVGQLLARRRADFCTTQC
jgi:hypothetical protein